MNSIYYLVHPLLDAAVEVEARCFYLLDNVEIYNRWQELLAIALCPIEGFETTSNNIKRWPALWWGAGILIQHVFMSILVAEVL